MKIKKVKNKNFYIISSNFGKFFSIKNKGENFFSQTLIIEGLGYEINLSKNQKYLLIRLGYSHLYALKIPKSISFFFITTKKIKFFSNNLNLLMNWIFKIKNLKKKNSYKKKGFFLENERILLKKGKSLK